MMNQPALRSNAPIWGVADKSDSAVCQLVQHVLDESKPALHQPERRQFERYPFPLLLTLTPVADHEIVAIDEPLVVVGKHLALRGLDFYHREPLPYRRVIISFDDLVPDVHLVLLISWCRFLRPGWYDSGGRFTHVVYEQGGGLAGQALASQKFA